MADLDHVTHAVKFLRPGGTLVAIVAGGVLFRDNARTEAFRVMVADRGGTIEALPEDTFKAAGTSVRTALVTFTAA